MRRRLLITCLCLLLPAVAAAQDSSGDYTRPVQREALEIYREAVQTRTAAGQGLVPKLAESLMARFRAGGFPEEDVHVLPMTVDSGEETASLVVRYRGDGSSGKKPILLLAHMDVVDALSSDWERDPFTLIEENGYFFGRGTFDDKFSVALLTATFLDLKATGFVPTRDLIVAFTGDEESGMLTARDLATAHRDLVDAEFALNGDAGGGTLDDEGNPVVYLLQTSEKTYATFELTTRNPGGHSSQPRADNAIYELAGALEKIAAYRFPVTSNTTTRAYFAATAKVTGGELGEAMRRFAEDPTDAVAAEVLASEPTQVGVTRTTCVATMLRGGHAENALPQSATATVNCRIFPGVEIADIQRKLQEVVADEAVEIRLIGHPAASPASPVRDDVLDAVAVAVDSLHPGTPVVPYMAPYGTDGKELRAAGIPTYGVGATFIRAADEFAHGLNERVPVRSFFEGLDHWRILLTELAGHRPGLAGGP